VASTNWRKKIKISAMQEAENSLPFYKEINDALESFSTFRTKNPLFYCLRLKASNENIKIYKPPFKKGFYFISFVTNAGKTEITFDTRDVTKLDSFLVFQAPGQVYSFLRDSTADGFIIYFKKECLDFFLPNFETTFSFFDLLHTNFYKLNTHKYNEFKPHFEYLFDTYHNVNNSNYQASYALFLSLLFRLKEFTAQQNQLEQDFTSPQQLLFQKFVQLVNSNYLTHRTIEEYASLLNVTPNHLSQSIKNASSQNALSIINERILKEAKQLILYTDFDIAEIAYQLHFSDPANFGKFFKKHTEMTPLEFRKSK
jgi:AraC family transcriptional regulator, transcriptional activator of pobA